MKTADLLLSLGDLPQGAENRVGSFFCCPQHVHTEAILPALSSWGSPGRGPSTLEGEPIRAPCPALTPPSSHSECLYLLKMPMSKP